MKLSDTARFSTVCIHAGQEPDPSTGAIITPIYQTATYVQEAVGQALRPVAAGAAVDYRHDAEFSTSYGARGIRPVASSTTRPAR